MNTQTIIKLNGIDSLAKVFESQKIKPMTGEAVRQRTIIDNNLSLDQLMEDLETRHNEAKAAAKAAELANRHIVCRSSDGVAFENWQEAKAYADKHGKQLLDGKTVVYPMMRDESIRGKAVYSGSGKLKCKVQVPQQVSDYPLNFAKGRFR